MSLYILEQFPMEIGRILVGYIQHLLMVVGPPLILFLTFSHLSQSTFRTHVHGRLPANPQQLKKKKPFV